MVSSDGNESQDETSLFEVGSMQVESSGKTEYVVTFDDEGRSTPRGGK